jgi:hypothetical protein
VFATANPPKLMAPIKKPTNTLSTVFFMFPPEYLINFLNLWFVG